MAAGENADFQGDIRAYLRRSVLMTGFLTRAIPAPAFLAAGGPFAFDLQAVYQYYFFKQAYVQVKSVLPGAQGEAPLWATWLPQGGNCVVPLNPGGGGGGAGLVLTAELTGCALVADRTPAGLRIYHVQPNAMWREYQRRRNAMTDHQLCHLTAQMYDSGNYNANVVVYWNGADWRLICQRWAGAFINQLAGAYIDNFAFHDTIEMDVT